MTECEYCMAVEKSLKWTGMHLCRLDNIKSQQSMKIDELKRELERILVESVDFVHARKIARDALEKIWEVKP